MFDVATASGRALGVGIMATAFVFGLRHGIDWDHIAAITDLTGTATTPRRSLLLATCYALGHAAIVFVLGVGAVVFAERLPDGVDAVMERVVGATLLLLGVYVLVSLARNRRDFRMRSRWMLVIAAARRAIGAVRARGRPRLQEFVVIEHEHAHHHDHGQGHGHAHVAAPLGHAGHPHAVGRAEHAVPDEEPATSHRHRHRHVLPVPDDPFAAPGVGAAVGIGALHGVGAETPTQVVVFVGAAGASGALAGFGMLVSFLIGLLVSNTAIAIAATFGNLARARRFPASAAVSVVTALFSLAVGAVYVVGQGNVLPTILGG